MTILANKLWLVIGLVGISAVGVQAETMHFSLDNVILEDGHQITGTFSWTYEMVISKMELVCFPSWKFLIRLTTLVMKISS